MAELENQEIKDEELNGVSGGYYMAPFQPYTCQVTNVYWGNTYMSDGPYNALIGHIMQIVYNPGAVGPCKYQLMNNGTYMGWTIDGHFRLL